MDMTRITKRQVFAILAVTNRVSGLVFGGCPFQGFEACSLTVWLNKWRTVGAPRLCFAETAGAVEIGAVQVFERHGSIHWHTWF